MFRIFLFFENKPKDFLSICALGLDFHYLIIYWVYFDNSIDIAYIRKCSILFFMYYIKNGDLYA